MARKPKPEWQVRAEAARKDAEALQRAFDASARIMGKDAADSLAYGVIADLGDGSHYALTLREDAERAHALWSFLMDRLRDDLKSGLRKVDVLRKDLETRTPAEALRWASEAFQGAAEAEVYGTVISFLESRGPAKLGAFIREQLLRAAREAAPRSTSACSNLIKANKAVAWAGASERILSGWLGSF